MNKNLQSAKANKNDEFYTQLRYIENELRHYRKHFEGKVVYCNCDDPRVSNFFRYFSYNFDRLKLKKLITTCYKSQDIDLFTQHETEKAIYLEYSGEKDGGRVPTIENIGIHHLEGDGDFQSPESIELLKKADIVVTNPPFSLYNEYIAQLKKYNKKFLIIGNYNSVTYTEVFPSIIENKIWLGVSPRSMEFDLPDGGTKTVNSAWFTNLDHDKRHEELPIFRRYKGNEDNYPKYDNYDAIEVGKVADIPMDYEGVMGVPITFLTRYNPKQFEVVGASESEGKGFSNGLWDPESKVSQPLVSGDKKYKRLFIKHRKQGENK